MPIQATGVMSDLPRQLRIQPVGSFQTSFRPPGSKSLTNRSLLLAALAEGTSTLSGVLLSDDSYRLIEALQTLGFRLAVDVASNQVTVTGTGGGVAVDRARLDLGLAGTALRPLCALCSLWPGQFTLDGNDRMRKRPVGQLVDALRQLGARIDYPLEEGYPPIEVHGGSLLGGEVAIAEAQSSQFITALLMVGPLCPQGITIAFPGPVTSRSYVEMTLGLMKRFGVEPQLHGDWKKLAAAPAKYQCTDYQVEPDASSAGYFWATAALIAGSKCTIEGLGKESLQGDVGFADVLHQMGADLVFGRQFITVGAPSGAGCLRGIDIDMNRMPDAAMTLAAIAPLCEGATTIRNIANLRVKETDRLAALQTELTKVGARVEVSGGDFHIEPPPNSAIQPATIRTYDDHRMAMSFTVLGLAADGITIDQPACVSKTFPHFFEYVDRLK